MEVIFKKGSLNYIASISKYNLAGDILEAYCASNLKRPSIYLKIISIEQPNGGRTVVTFEEVEGPED